MLNTMFRRTDESTMIFHRWDKHRQNSSATKPYLSDSLCNKVKNFFDMFENQPFSLPFLTVYLYINGNILFSKDLSNPLMQSNGLLQSSDKTIILPFLVYLCYALCRSSILFIFLYVRLYSNCPLFRFLRHAVLFLHITSVHKA